MRKLIVFAVAAVMGNLPALAAAADDFPNRPIRMVVPYAAGGITDMTGRLLADKMGAFLGQTVVVENRPGAAGTLGTQSVVKSEPDGYTVVLSTGGALTINNQLMKTPPYDVTKDLTPIAIVTLNNAVLVANNAFPANNFKEFLEIVRKSPGKYAYGSAGTGNPTHLGGELLKSTAGIDILHVPYKGDGPAAMGLMGNDVQLMIGVYGSVIPQIQAGQMKALAAMGTKRFAGLPEVATVAESGYPDYSLSTWGGLFGPAGMPAKVTAKLNAAVHHALSDPALKEQYVRMSSEGPLTTPEETAEFVRSEYEKWGKVIREANIAVN